MLKKYYDVFYRYDFIKQVKLMETANPCQRLNVIKLQN